MINIKNTSRIFICLMLLFSCGGGNTENDQVKQETPKALQDNEISLKMRSYERQDDLTEKLYQELVEKTAELKQLEGDLEALEPKQYNTNEQFRKYDEKSISYYYSADINATAITDSLLKNKIQALVKASQNKYAGKTTELQALLKQISKNEITLKDHHAVLKIVLTLPLIEKYQNDNKPGKKEFKNLVKEQEMLIERTDSLTSDF